MKNLFYSKLNDESACNVNGNPFSDQDSTHFNSFSTAIATELVRILPPSVITPTGSIQLNDNIFILSLTDDYEIIKMCDHFRVRYNRAAIQSNTLLKVGYVFYFIFWPILGEVLNYVFVLTFSNIFSKKSGRDESWPSFWPVQIHRGFLAWMPAVSLFSSSCLFSIYK